MSKFNEDKDAKNYKCECFCGEIQFEVLGFPIVTNCHCSTCRKWTSNSFSTNCVFRLEGLKVTKGKDSIKKMETSKKLIRNFCEKCGGRIYNYGTENDVLTVPLGCIKEDFKDQKITSSELNPSSHICYEERVFDVVDNRIKFQGVPGPGRTKILWFQWLVKSYFHYLLILLLSIYVLFLQFGKKKNEE